jgi:hypothetical protein
MTNNKQQTAVEWFGIEMAEYLRSIYGNGIVNIDILQQAKEMEIAGKEMSYADGYAEGYKRGLGLVKHFNLKKK